MSINKVVLSGRLTKDPEIRHTQGGTCVAHYTVAVNRRKKEDDGTVKADFINCVVIGNGAEHAEKYYRKGMKIDLSGRIQTGSYTNRDGVKCHACGYLLRYFRIRVKAGEIYEIAMKKIAEAWNRRPET